MLKTVQRAQSLFRKGKLHLTDYYNISEAILLSNNGTLQVIDRKRLQPICEELCSARLNGGHRLLLETVTMNEQKNGLFLNEQDELRYQLTKFTFFDIPNMKGGLIDYVDQAIIYLSKIDWNSEVWREASLPHHMIRSILTKTRSIEDFCKTASLLHSSFRYLYIYCL
jgi:hypothetical protein